MKWKKESGAENDTFAVTFIVPELTGCGTRKIRT